MPFKSIYGIGAVIPVEFGNPTWRMSHLVPDNDQSLQEELDLVDEVRELARIKEVFCKQ
jgi:hypothetical protein